MSRGALYVSAAMMLYGMSPFLSKELYSGGIGVTTVLFWRSALVIPFLLVVAYCSGAHPVLRPKRAFELMLTVAVFGSASSYCVNMAYSLMDTGLAATIYFLYPIFVVAITALVRRRLPARSTALSALLIGVGMAFVGGQARGSVGGVVFALVAAAFYSVYIVRLEVAGFNGLGPMSLTLYIAATNSLLFLVMGTLSGGVRVDLPMDAWRRLICLSFITLCALALIGAGSKELSPDLVAVFGLFEPLTSLFMGVVFMGESLSAAAVFGCALIFAALMLVSVHKPSGASVVEHEGLVDRGVALLVRYL